MPAMLSHRSLVCKLSLIVNDRKFKHEHSTFSIQPSNSLLLQLLLFPPYDQVLPLEGASSTFFLFCFFPPPKTYILQFIHLAWEFLEKHSDSDDKQGCNSSKTSWAMKRLYWLILVFNVVKPLKCNIPAQTLWSMIIKPFNIACFSSLTLVRDVVQLFVNLIHCLFENC